MMYNVDVLTSKLFLGKPERYDDACDPVNRRLRFAGNGARCRGRGLPAGPLGGGEIEANRAIGVR